MKKMLSVTFIIVCAFAVLLQTDRRSGITIVRI